MGEGGKEVLVERRGDVQWVILNRPERRNAINAEVIHGVTEAMLSAAKAGVEEGLRAVVVTGAGDKAFCAGADLQKRDESKNFGFDPSQPRHPFVRMFEAFEACDLPIVARVNGPVMAGGVGLLCACDMAVAVDDALVGTPEAKVGLFPMMILSYMQRLIPRRKLMEMCLTGEPWTAAQALEVGLYNYVVPPTGLDEKVAWLLGRLLDKSPSGQRIGKHALRVMMDMTLSQGFAFSQLQLPMMTLTEDAREGLVAFNEKRPPKFQGK